MSSDFELLDFGPEFEAARIRESTTIISAKFLFLTREDADVDPIICAPLNRTVYDMWDPDIPQLPLYRHCRCKLIPLIEGQNPDELSI